MMVTTFRDDDDTIFVRGGRTLNRNSYGDRRERRAHRTHTHTHTRARVHTHATRAACARAHIHTRGLKCVKRSPPLLFPASSVCRLYVSSARVGIFSHSNVCRHAVRTCGRRFSVKRSRVPVTSCLRFCYVLNPFPYARSHFLLIFFPVVDCPTKSGQNPPKTRIRYGFTFVTIYKRSVYRHGGYYSVSDGRIVIIIYIYISSLDCAAVMAAGVVAARAIRPRGFSCTCTFATPYMGGGLALFVFASKLIGFSPGRPIIVKNAKRPLWDYRRRFVNRYFVFQPVRGKKNHSAVFFGNFPILTSPFRIFVSFFGLRSV